MCQALFYMLEILQWMRQRPTPQVADTLVRRNVLEIEIQNDREVKYLVIAYHCIHWT